VYPCIFLIFRWLAIHDLIREPVFHFPHILYIVHLRFCTIVKKFLDFQMANIDVTFENFPYYLR
jgi:hypothetical protein